MRYLKIAACLVALIFSLSSLAAAAECTYSGVPGKWKRGCKESKDKSAEPAAAAREPQKEQGKRTVTMPMPKITYTPGTPQKKEE